MPRPKYIDIHAHTNFAVFDADRKEVIKRALDASVWMINVGVNRQTSMKAVEIARQFNHGVYAIVGLHPIHVNPSFDDPNKEDFDPKYYRNLIAKAPKGKIVGIGECGLDYYREPTEDEKKRQIEAFRAQIELALECDLPLMLHIRSAYGEVVDILTSYKKSLSLGQIKGPDGTLWSPERLRGDAHFFAGSKEEAKKFLDLGFCLSYTGVVTFAKQYEELVEITPMDRIMSETDCPYVAPVPERGKRNEPFFVAHTALKILDIKNMGGQEGREHLVSNAFRLFGL